jgi:hypothetical protein
MWPTSRPASSGSASACVNWSRTPPRARSVRLVPDHAYGGKFDCDECERDLLGGRFKCEWSMVHDALRASAGLGEDDTLCIECFEKRLGRELMPDDFTNVELKDANDANTNWMWTDLFVLRRTGYKRLP